MTTSYQLDTEPAPKPKVRASDVREARLLLPEEDPTVWISRSGEVTPIPNMAHSHLMSAIKVQEREGRFDNRYVCLLAEALDRGLIKSIITTLI